MFKTHVTKQEYFQNFPIVGPNLLKEISAVGFRHWNGEIESVYLGSLVTVLKKHFPNTFALESGENPMAPIDKGELACIGSRKNKDVLEPICNFGLQHDKDTKNQCWYILVEQT